MAQETSRIAVMSALAVETAFNRWIIPTFEAETGFRIDASWQPTTLLVQSIETGDRADVLVAIDSALDRFVEEGILDRATRIPLAHAVLGVAIKAGAPRPDISSLQAFKQTLSESGRVAISHAGASGIYFRDMIGRLGIADAVGRKIVTIPAGFTAEKVVSGEAEMAVQQISELMTVAGVDIIGPFPPEVQVSTSFSAAAFRDAKNPAGARAFLEALGTPQAEKAYRDGGLISRIAPQTAAGANP